MAPVIDVNGCPSRVAMPTVTRRTTTLDGAATASATVILLAPSASDTTNRTVTHPP